MMLPALKCAFFLAVLYFSITTTHNSGLNGWKSLSASSNSSEKTCGGKSCDKLVILGLINGFFTPEVAIPSPNRFVPPQNDRLTGPAGSKQCLLETAQIILDAINEKGNILSGYKLVLRFYDEDVSKMFVPQIATDFFANEDNTMSDAKSYISPLYFGPNQGCAAEPLTSILNEAFDRISSFHKLDQFRSAECPNRYDSQIYINHSPTNVITPHNVAYAAALSFVQSPYTGWRQIGIIADSLALVLDGTQVIKLSEKLLAQNGIELVFFDVGNNYLEMFTKLKRSRARIIVLASEYNANWDCANVLCSAHMAGIRAPKYVLIFTSYRCFVVAWIPPVLQPPSVDGRSYHICEQSVLYEQLRISIFSEQFTVMRLVMTQNSLINSISYIANNAQSLMDDIADNTTIESKLSPMCKNTTTSRTISFRKAFLSTVLTLNLTEHSLSNLTLRNFRQFPGKIADAVTEAATELSFWGTGANEMANDAIVAWIHQMDFRDISHPSASLMAQIIPYDVSTRKLITNFSQHYNELVAPELFWETSDRKPPKDLSAVEHRRDDQFPIALSLSCVSVALTVVQQLVAIRKQVAKSTPVYLDRTNNQILLIGCYVLNLSALLISMGSLFFFSELCYFRQVLPCMGVAIVNAMVLARTLAMPTFSSLHRYLPQKRRNANSFNFQAFESDREMKLARLQKWVQWVLLGIIVGHLLILLIWLCTDPVGMKVAVLHADDPLYDSDHDSYYDVTIEWCESKSEVYLFAILAACHFLALFLSAMLALSLKQKLKYVRKRFQSEIVTIRWAAINSASLLLFAPLVLVVTPFAYKPTAFVACLLVYSASNSAIVYYPVWSQNMNPRKWLSSAATSNQ